jgi:sulfide dehydrogenase [flavocytochrome c] flavoprotein chain
MQYSRCRIRPVFILSPNSATGAVGEAPPTPKLINTCYSLVAPDYGISIAGVYQPANGQLTEVAGSGGVSLIDAPRSTRALEASLANGWFNTITTEAFG